MAPAELHVKILRVAEYLDGEDKPSRAMVTAAVRTLLIEVRTAGSVTELVDRNFDAAVIALEALTKRLSEAAQTLNPQDETREVLEGFVGRFQDLKSAILTQFKDLSSVNT